MDIVVGHVKLSRADGRSDGACCISYSLVVDDGYVFVKRDEYVFFEELLLLEILSAIKPFAYGFPLESRLWESKYEVIPLN